MDNYNELDLVLEYLNAEDEVVQEKAKDKIKTVAAVITGIGAVIVTGAIFIALLPLMIVIVAIMLMISKSNTRAKQDGWKALLQNNPELKSALKNLAVKTQQSITKSMKSQGKYFKSANIELDYHNLNIENNEIQIHLGHLDCSSLTGNNFREFALGILWDNLPQKEKEKFADNYEEGLPDDELRENYIEYNDDPDAWLIYQACPDNATYSKVINAIYKKYPDLLKSYKLLQQITEELSKGYKEMSGSTFITVKFDNKELDEDVREYGYTAGDNMAAECAYNAYGIGACVDMIIKYVDFSNVELPEVTKNLVNAQINKMKK